jgi:hypothetical protein
MHVLIVEWNLVGIQKRAEAILNPEDIVVNCIQILCGVVDVCAGETQYAICQR